MAESAAVYDSQASIRHLCCHELLVHVIASAFGHETIYSYGLYIGHETIYSLRLVMRL